MQQIAGKKAPGPSTYLHNIPCLLCVGAYGAEALGRNKLAEKLNVGDGAVRTIISRLREADLIETSKEGCNLTKKGIRDLEAI